MVAAAASVRPADSSARATDAATTNCVGRCCPTGFSAFSRTFMAPVASSTARSAGSVRPRLVRSQTWEARARARSTRPESPRRPAVRCSRRVSSSCTASDSSPRPRARSRPARSRLRGRAGVSTRSRWALAMRGSCWRSERVHSSHRPIASRRRLIESSGSWAAHRASASTRRASSSTGVRSPDRSAPRAATSAASAMPLARATSPAARAAPARTSSAHTRVWASRWSARPLEVSWSAHAKAASTVVPAASARPIPAWTRATWTKAVK